MLTDLIKHRFCPRKLLLGRSRCIVKREMETTLPASCNDLESLVKHYHGITPTYTYREICAIINKHHRVATTVRHIKYVCKKQGLTRRVHIMDSELKDMIINELTTSRSHVGYRQMSEILNLKYNIQVAKERVRKCLKDVDPEGVEERSKHVIKRRIYETKGPNDVYHIDGNDKLKKWGFCIHGCVDGFSRKLMWLKVASTNNDPLVIANYYLSCVKAYGIAPKLLRMDRGTENIYCEDLQVFFTGNANSFRYAASTRNQRIEAYWSRLKKFRLKWWIHFFNGIFQQGLYQAHLETHQEVLLFCFLPIIQNELNEFGRTWNTRNVRQSESAPGGKPDILFNVPETSGYINQGIHIKFDDVDIAEAIIGIDHYPVWKSKDLHELLVCYININRLKVPTNSENAIDTYVKLLSILQNDGFDV